MRRTVILSISFQRYEVWQPSEFNSIPRGSIRRSNGLRTNLRVGTVITNKHGVKIGKKSTKKRIHDPCPLPTGSFATSHSCRTPVKDKISPAIIMRRMAAGKVFLPWIYRPSGTLCLDHAW
jgi:hypothetical protein